MKKKGVLLIIFISLMLILWATVSSLPSFKPQKEISNVTDPKNTQLCGSDITMSNLYLNEYKLPEKCGQPLALISDPYENLWFTQTTTNSVSKFNQFKKLFSTYHNNYQTKEKSMIWGVDYSHNELWYTGNQGHIWNFDTISKNYHKILYPYQNSLPQRIKIMNYEMIINDFTGNKIVIISPIPISPDTNYLAITSPLKNSFTSDFAIDSKKNIWYTNWIFQQHGSLIKTNYMLYKNDNNDLTKQMKVYELPDDVISPNGLSIDKNDNIWITDTSSNSFFKFASRYDDKNFINYTTSNPPISTYGNYSEVIKNPISRPYWNEIHDDKIIFNEQTSNSIAEFYITDEKLIERLIPTKNPNWADCGHILDCGISQLFGFTIHENDIWFTEWVENNLGMINTLTSTSFDVNIIESLKTKNRIQLILKIHSKANNNIINIINNTTSLNTAVNTHKNKIILDKNEFVELKSIITTNSYSKEKVLIGGRNSDLTISKYVTINN